MARRLSAVAQSVAGRLIGADTDFGAVSTDTRSLAPGSLFVAIRGERFDGNDYIAAAAERGAAGALVSRPGDARVAQVAVADTRLAFFTLNGGVHLLHVGLFAVIHSLPCPRRHFRFVVHCIVI